MTALDAQRDAMDMPALRQACFSYDTDAAVRAVLAGHSRGLEDFKADVSAAYRGPLRASGRLAASEVPVQARAAAVEVGIKFDVTSKAAQEWIDVQAGSLVVEVNARTKAAVRSIIAKGFAEGLTPVQMARAIKDVVGLTKALAVAVHDAKADLRQASRDARASGTSRVVRIGSITHTDADGVVTKRAWLRVRVPATGLSADRIAAIGSRYANRLRKYRAMNIARTETMRASNAGQLIAWSDAVGQGLLPRTAQKKWITYNPCPRCAPLAGETQDVLVAFSAGVLYPPLHPSCRCTYGLVPN